MSNRKNGIVMQKIFNPKPENWTNILERPTQTVDDIETTVSQIFSEVQKNGDQAIKKYTSFFDNVKLNNFVVSQAEIDTAANHISEELKNAIAIAKANITKFHKAQETTKVEIETTKGVRCWQEKRAIQKVGLYIPGGTAPLFSTILMLAVPAKIAGCNEIILCTPPNKEGKVNPAILYTAKLCGITKIYKVTRPCFGPTRAPAPGQAARVKSTEATATAPELGFRDLELPGQVYGTS